MEQDNDLGMDFFKEFDVRLMELVEKCNDIKGQANHNDELLQAFSLRLEGVEARMTDLEVWVKSVNFDEQALNNAIEELKAVKPQVVEMVTAPQVIEKVTEIIKETPEKSNTILWIALAVNAILSLLGIAL